MTHTPGPWIADGFSDCQLITKDVPPAIGRPIGIGKIYSPNMVDDAKLIAAAPELLEVAKVLLAFTKGTIERANLTDTNGIVAAAEAVIAKATT